MTNIELWHRGSQSVIGESFRACATIVLAFLIVAAPVSADPRIDEIRTLVRGGDAERAEVLAKALVKAEPSNAEAHNVYGEVLSVRINQVNVFRKMGMAGDMRGAWERAVGLDPNHLDAHMSLLRYYLQAPAIAGGGRDKALAQAERIAAVDKAAGYRAKAVYWTSGEEFDKALAEYEAAAAEFPDDLDIHFEYGLYLQRVEDWDRAVEVHAAIAAADATRMDAEYQVGRTAVMSGRHLEQGAAALRRYLGHTPGAGGPPMAWAHTRLGQVYLHMKRKDDARVEFKRALALDPKHEEAMKRLAALDRN